jgi:hypothetical protein
MYDVDMLYEGAASGNPKDIPFQYFLLSKSSLLNAPHLFADGSPLLLLTIILKDSSTVSSLLAHSSISFEERIMATATGLLQDLDREESGTGFVAAFSQLQEQFKNTWSSASVSDYLGYGLEGTYITVADKPAPMFCAGQAEGHVERERRKERREEMRKKRLQ